LAHEREKVTKFTAIKIINESDDAYAHRIQGMKLYIEQDDKFITLNDDEIMDMLEKLGIATSDFKNGYWYKDGRQG